MVSEWSLDGVVSDRRLDGVVSDRSSDGVVEHKMISFFSMPCDPA